MKKQSSLSSHSRNRTSQKTSPYAVSTSSSSSSHRLPSKRNTESKSRTTSDAVSTNRSQPSSSKPIIKKSLSLICHIIKARLPSHITKPPSKARDEIEPNSKLTARRKSKSESGVASNEQLKDGMKENNQKEDIDNGNTLILTPEDMRLAKFNQGAEPKRFWIALFYLLCPDRRPVEDTELLHYVPQKLAGMCYPRSSILLSYTDINESSTRELLFASAFVIRRLDLFGWYIKQSTKSAKTASLPIPFPQYLTSYNRKDDLDLRDIPLISTYPQIPHSQLESHLQLLSHSVTLHLRHYHNLVQSHSTKLHNLNILSSSIPALFQPLLSINDTLQNSLDREFDAAKRIPTFEELKLLSNPESIKESFVKIQSEKEIITMNRKLKELEKVWWLWMTSVLEDTPCQEVDIELGENDATSLLTELHEYLTLQSQHLKAQLESLLPTSTSPSAIAPSSNEDISSYSSPPSPFLSLPLNARTQTLVHSSTPTRVYYSFLPNAESLKKSKAVKTSSKSMSSQPCGQQDRRETRNPRKDKDESQPFIVVSAEDEIQRLKKELESVRSRLWSQQIQS